MLRRLDRQNSAVLAGFQLGRLLLALLVALTVANGSAGAVEPDEMLKDPALEARARKISAELRCLVCQNQSIDDSNAGLARDLRVLVRERLKAGESDEAILDFAVARYGEFVLLRPRFGWHTLVLWLAPLMVLLAGIWLARRAMAGRAAVAPTGADALSPDEAARLKAVLERENNRAS